MIIFCTICSDLINPSENIFVTKCGHLFHYDCLHTWIVKSKSCPQCRHKVTEKCMYRVFPNTTDTIPSADENAANLETKLNHTLLTLNQQGLELKSCYDNFIQIQTALETHEKAVKILEEKFASNEDLVFMRKQHLMLLESENVQLKKEQEESEIQRKNVRALQRALYELDSKNNDLHSRLLAALRELTEEKKMSAEWHSKFIQIKEKFSTVVNKYESMKNEIKKSLCLEDPWCMHEFNTPLPSNNAKESNDTSLHTLIKAIESTDIPYLNLEQSNIAYAALQYPTTSKDAVLIKAESPDCPKGKMILCFGRHVKPLAPATYLDVTRAKSVAFGGFITRTRVCEPLKQKLLQVSDTNVSKSASDQNGNFCAFAIDKDPSRSEYNLAYDRLGWPILRTIPMTQRSDKLSAKHGVKCIR